MLNKSLLSTLTIATVGLGSKGFLKYICSDVKVVGLFRLLDALECRRPQNSQDRCRGILTVSNHISVLDDPLLWGVLPSSHYTHARPMRWALGASDICFTNQLLSTFFKNGQVLETFRGGGIKQAAVDKTIQLLNAGEWIHIFPEGKIAQPAHSNLGRLKWGIGRILMEVKQIPTIIPAWLTGFDAIMPETRGFPRFLPRPGNSVSITFGESHVIEERISATLDGQTLAEFVEADLRAQITQIVQDELEKLGEQVSGQVTEEIQEGKERRPR